MSAHLPAGSSCDVHVSPFGIRVGFHCPDPDGWRRVLASWRAAFSAYPGTRWNHKDKVWTLPVHASEKVHEWCSSVGFPEVVWTGIPPTSSGARSPGSGAGREGSSDRRRRFPPGVTRALEDFAAELALAPDAPPELVEAARRIWARRHHPDAGGDEEMMKRINAAADALLSRVAQ